MRVNSSKDLTLLLVRVVFCLFVSMLKSTGKTEMVDGCIDSQLNLSCDAMMTINILSVVLGDSKCWRTGCCPTNDSCTQNITDSQLNEVKSQCNGRQRCSLDVIKQGISCGTLGWWSNNDFERITFDCIEEPAGGATESGVTQDSRTRPMTAEIVVETNTFLRSGTFLTLAVMIALIVVIIIIVAMTIAKKKKGWAKFDAQVTDVRNTTSEGIYENDDQMLNDFYLSSSFSSDQIDELQGDCPASSYDIPNSVTKCGIVGKQSKLNKASSGPQYCVEECVARKDNGQQDSAKDFVYSLAIDSDGPGGDIYADISVSVFQNDSSNSYNRTKSPEYSHCNDVDQILVENVLYSGTKCPRENNDVDLILVENLLYGQKS